jgi:hypothetical protein
VERERLRQIDEDTVRIGARFDHELGLSADSELIARFQKRTVHRE